MTRPAAADLERIRPRCVVSGLDGTVAVPAALAAEVALLLKVGMHEVARRDAVAVSPGVHELIAGCEWAAAAVDADVVLSIETATVSAILAGVDEVGIAEAARIVGVTPQAIDGRLRRRTLPYRTDHRGRRRIRRSNLLEAYGR